MIAVAAAFLGRCDEIYVSLSPESRLPAKCLAGPESTRSPQSLGLGHGLAQRQRVGSLFLGWTLTVERRQPVRWTTPATPGHFNWRCDTRKSWFGPNALTRTLTGPRPRTRTRTRTRPVTVTLIITPDRPAENAHPPEGRRVTRLAGGQDAHTQAGVADPRVSEPARRMAVRNTWQAPGGGEVHGEDVGKARRLED